MNKKLSGVLALLDNKYARYPVLFAALAGLYFLSEFLGSELENRDKQIAHLNLVVQDLEDGKKKLKDAISQQNAEIEKWRTISDELDKQAEELASEITDIKEASAEEVAAILNEAKPKDCASAIKYLVDGVQDLKWKE